MKPYLFEVFGFKIPTYGVMVATAYIVGYLYLSRKAKEFSINEKEISDLVFYSVVGGFLGAKILYILTFFRYFGENFSERLVNVFSLENLRSGFVFFGGLIGGFISFVLYIKKKGLDFYQFADLFSPAVALGHAIGRLGCFSAGCCHGKATEFFLGVRFTSPYCEVSPDLLGVKIHPSQLYESFGNIMIFLFLNSKLGKMKKGDIFLSYLFLYSLLRFFVEFTRGDERGGFFGPFSQAQFISVLIIFFVVLWKRLKR